MTDGVANGRLARGECAGISLSSDICKSQMSTNGRKPPKTECAMLQVMAKPVARTSVGNSPARAVGIGLFEAAISTAKMSSTVMIDIIDGALTIQ